MHRPTTLELFTGGIVVNKTVNDIKKGERWVGE